MKNNMETENKDLIQQRLEAAQKTPYVFNNITNAALELGIFEVLKGGSMSLEELAGKTSTNSFALHQFLNVLAGLGYISFSADMINVTNSGLELKPVKIETDPQSAGPLNALWPYLAEAIREGGPQWYRVLGGEPGEGDIFSKFYEEGSENLKKFCEFMNMSSVPAGGEIADKYDFSKHKLIMDIAGGLGGLSVAICKKYPNLQGIVMDLPKVCQLAKDYFEKEGVENRFRAIDGNLFEGPYPKEADISVLSWVLHDWSDNSSLTILKNTYESLPSGGVLMLSECILGEDGLGKVGHRIQAEVLSLMMLLSQEKGAHERTFVEFRNLLEKAGFVDVSLKTMNGPRDLIIANKP